MFEQSRSSRAERDVVLCAVFVVRSCWTADGRMHALCVTRPYACHPVCTPVGRSAASRYDRWGLSRVVSASTPPRPTSDRRPRARVLTVHDSRSSRLWPVRSLRAVSLTQSCERGGHRLRGHRLRVCRLITRPTSDGLGTLTPPVARTGAGSAYLLPRCLELCHCLHTDSSTPSVAGTPPTVGRCRHSADGSVLVSPARCRHHRNTTSAPRPLHQATSR